MEGRADEVLALLKDLKEEQAAFANGIPDALDRLRKLAARANELDPYYRFEFQSDGAEAGVRIIPRYPGAEEARPITVNMVLSFPDTEEGRIAKAAFEQSFEYGVAARIESEFVQTIEIDAPAGLGGRHEGGTVEISRSIDPPASVELALAVVEPDGRTVASVPVQLTRESAGTRGAILVGSDRSGLLRLHLVTDVQEGKLTGTIRTNASADTFLPLEILPVVRLVSAFGPTCRIALRTRTGENIGSFAEGPTDSPWAGDGLITLLEDLASLQQASGKYHPVSLDFTDDDLRELQRATRLLNGETIETTWNTISMTMEIETPDSWPKPDQANSYLFRTSEPETVTIAGASYQIGHGVEIQLDSAFVTQPTIQQLAAAGPGVAIEAEMIPADSNLAKVRLLLTPD